MSLRRSGASERSRERCISTSLTPSFGTSIITLEALSIDDLKTTITNLKEEKLRMQVENEIFQNFLNINEPSMIADMDDILERVYQMQKEVALSHTVSYVQPQQQQQSGADPDTSGNSARRSSVLPMSKGPRINLTQKMDLVLREIEEIQSDYEQFITKARKVKFNLRAELEELETRTIEVEEFKEAFETFVVAADSTTTISVKIPAERFVRYMLEWLKTAVTLLEKMRLRTISSKIQFQKLKVQHALKEELGESVDEVDLERMEIERVRMKIKIKQKNKNLLELKKMNSKANLMLVAHKKLLAKQHEHLSGIKLSTEKTLNSIAELKIICEETEKEVEIDQQKLQDLKLVIRQYTVPPVMDYIEAKSQLSVLAKEMKIWHRRIGVQNVGLKTYTKLMCQITGYLRPRKSWQRFKSSYTRTAEQHEAAKESSPRGSASSDKPEKKETDEDSN